MTNVQIPIGKKLNRRLDIVKLKSTVKLNEFQNMNSVALEKSIVAKIAQNSNAIITSLLHEVRLHQKEGDEK